MDRNLVGLALVGVRRVALRKESVDRNALRLPLRRPVPVALRKESVDRNRVTDPPRLYNARRSPQGERG